jgi:Tripartite tricarboxylate transporter family receptor
MPEAMTRRRALALMGSLVPAAAFGAAYPERPVRLIVALAAGGPADTAARVFAPYLSEALGQSVFIENRTGASSVIGTEAVVRATPDGYTLLFGSSSSFAVNPAVMKSLRFDVQKDLKLVSLVSYTPHVLVVRGSLAVTSLADLVALAKRQPGKLTYASSGAGGAIHLASELFKREAGVDLVHIPYRGGGPAMVGLLAGDVDRVHQRSQHHDREHPWRQDQGVGHGMAFAFAVPAGDANICRARLSGGGVILLVRSRRSGQHAGRDHRAPGAGGEASQCIAGISGEPQETRKRAICADPGAIGRVYQDRNRQVDRRGAVRQYPDRIAR